ncbi:MAG: hypothetical protein ABH807_03255 [Candidatus Shapirobacteria bacterium]
MSFHTSLFARVEVFFYRGLILLGLSSLVVLLGLIVYKKKNKNGWFTVKDLILVLVVLISGNLVFFTHLPVTAERSISVFLLGYLNKNPQTALTDQEMIKVFIDKYVSADDAVGKRLREQMVSGNVIFDGSGYKISPRGRWLMKLYTLIADIFKIDNKLISP